MQIKADPIPCGVPAVVLSAFAMELYLKSLALLAGVKPRNKHTLQSLYNQLPANYKNDIKATYDAVLPTWNKAELPKASPDGVQYELSHYSFENVLSRLSNAFDDWRYYFESDRALAFTGNGLLSHAFEKTILKIKPEWQALLDTAGPMPQLLFK